MTEFGDVRLELVRRALKNSRYITQGGFEALSYMNLDDVIFGDDRQKNHAEWLETFVTSLVTEIGRIAQENNVSRLAFIDKGGQGPVGVLPLAGAILLRSKLDGALIKPYKRTLRSMYRGKAIAHNERFLIVSDVSTSGRTILSAAEVIRMHGGIVDTALALYDQGAGASENLAPKGITLISFADRLYVEGSGDQALIESLSPPPRSLVELGATI